MKRIIQSLNDKPRAAGGNYDPRAQSYFNQLTGTVSSAWKDAVNNAFISLQAGSNILSQLNTAYIYGAQNIQNTYINLIDPLQFTGTPVNGVLSLTPNRYTTGNGLSAINTNFTPSLNGGTIYTDFNASYGADLVSDIDELGCLMGSTNFSLYNSFFPKYFGDLYAEVNSNLFATINQATATGFYQIYRDLANIYVNKNGAALTSVAEPSLGRPAQSQFIFARQDPFGFPEYPSNNSLFFTFYGSGNINKAEFNTILTTLRNQIFAI